MPSDEKTEHGFLQVDNQILDLLLCDTQINIYGVLILAKIREYQRKKVQCFISNTTFAKMYKTSESMIKRQVTELYNLGLIESTVSLNDGTRGKLRLLKTPRNYTKVLAKILENKQYLDLTFKGQNSTLSSILTLEDDKKTDTFKGQNLGSKLDFDPRTEDTFKGQNLGSKSNIFKGHSDPITIDNTTIAYNNRFLEGETEVFEPLISTPSPASSTDDFRNEQHSERAFVSCASDDALPASQLASQNDAQCELQTASKKASNSASKSQSKKQETNVGSKSNKRYDEMTEWFTTQLNPISRYNYELRYKNAAVNFAWGERERKDNKKDYYTPQDIIEYFTEEKQLDYLRKINWEHCWMLDLNL